MRYPILIAGLVVLSVADAKFTAGRRKERLDETNFDFDFVKRNSSTLPDWKKTCRSNSDKTQANWKSMRMDYWLHTMADSIWEGTSTIGATSSPADLSFPQGIMGQITGDYEQRQCTMSQGGCSFSYPTGDPCTEGDFNAFYIFVLWAIENFQRWINSLAGSVESTCEDVISYSGELVDTFSHTKTPSTKNTAAEGLLIAVGILGALAAIIGGVGAVAEVAIGEGVAEGAAEGGAEAGAEAGAEGGAEGGAESGSEGGAEGGSDGGSDGSSDGSTVSGKITTGLNVLSGSAIVADGVVSQMAKADPDIGEMEGTRKAIIDARITKVKISLVDQIKSYGSTILTQAVDETQVGYSYSDHANSGPYVLKHGIYANEFSPNGQKSFAKSLKGSLLSGAISWVLKEEGVFLVKLSHAIDGTLPQDMNLDPDISNRTCDNNGTCYWFLKNTGIASPDTDVFKPVPGFDRLKDFGINDLEFAQAGDASQAAGGYLANWTMKDTLPFIKKYKPAKNMMVNLPVCSLDYFYGSWKDIDTGDYDYKSWDLNAFFRYFVSKYCHKQTVNGKSWPYAVLPGTSDNYEWSGEDGGGVPAE